MVWEYEGCYQRSEEERRPSFAKCSKCGNTNPKLADDYRIAPVQAKHRVCYACAIDIFKTPDYANCSRCGVAVTQTTYSFDGIAYMKRNKICARCYFRGRDLPKELVDMTEV